MAQYRHPEDRQLSQQRHEADAALHREHRLTDRLAMEEETPEEALERMQQNFEERMTTSKANKNACNALPILKGDQIVKYHYAGYFKTNVVATRTNVNIIVAMRCDFPERRIICAVKYLSGLYRFLRISNMFKHMEKHNIFSRILIECTGPRVRAEARCAGPDGPTLVFIYIFYHFI